MDACEYRVSPLNDSWSGPLLRRHGSYQERLEHDDDVDDNHRNR